MEHTNETSPADAHLANAEAESAVYAPRDPGAVEEFWDDRYRDMEQLWSGEPNATLTTERITCRARAGRRLWRGSGCPLAGRTGVGRHRAGRVAGGTRPRCRSGRRSRSEGAVAARRPGRGSLAAGIL